MPGLAAEQNMHGPGVFFAIFFLKLGYELMSPCRADHLTMSESPPLSVTNRVKR
jgi:hypothetical protein